MNGSGRILLGTIALLCVCIGASAQPANNDPCGAVTLPVNLTCVNTTGTNVAATATAGPPAPTCANYLGGDVWYQLTVPAGGTVTVNTTSAGGPVNDTGIAFYTSPGGACTGPFTQVGCDDDSGPGFYSTLTYIGAPGTILYVRVWEYGNNAFGPFNICATMPPAPPANNEPCAATTVTVGSSCSFTTYTNVNATNTSMTPLPGCGNFLATSRDVWFVFTAPATGIVIIETAAGTMTDAAMALYYDAPPLGCAGPFALVQCDDDSGPGNMPFLTFTNLTPGGTYYLRVWGYGTASGTFSLCLHGPATVPAGSCVYMLELFDTFGNGWGSSSVGISINGGAFTSYTVGGSYSIVLIGLNIGDILVVQYIATGPNQTQNRYELSYFPGGALIFNSGTPPAAGITFTQTVDCNPPPSPPEDCIGAITICSNGAFNNNTSNTGNVADLTSSNYGCLLSSERQGTWYTFSPSSGGQVGFTLAPIGPDDYDFAIWGPYAAGSTPGSICPPAGPPIRCSYAAGPATFGATGSYSTGTGSPIYSPPQWANPTPAYSETAAGDGWVPGVNTVTGQVYLMYVSNWSQSGIAFNLTWNLQGGASLDCTVLPIELLAFDARANGAVVELRWSTASEHDNDRFEIERSADGMEFVMIGSLDGAGTTHHQTEYLSLDPSPVSGMNYYRLKQVDVDGHFEHSAIVPVFFRPDADALLLFPNPGADMIGVVLQDGVREAAIEILDATGRRVRMHALIDRRTNIDASTLPEGIYTIRILSPQGGSLAQGKWVKQ